MPVYPLRLSVANPSFETGTAPGTGWSTVNGSPGFGTANPSPDPRGGNRYLVISTAGGAGSYRVRQDVPVPAEIWGDLDVGRLAATLRGLWANYAAGNDVGFVELAFLDGAGTTLAIAASGAFPDSVQSWSPFAFTASVPSGTHTLRLILGGTWTSGVSVDSYFDAIEAELVVSGAATASVAQMYAERLGDGASIVHAAQVYGEVLLNVPSPVRISQTNAELIRSVADNPATMAEGMIVCVIAG